MSQDLSPLFPMRTTNTLVQEEYDEVQVSYPSDVSEVYEFSLKGTLHTTVTVTYLEPQKRNIVSVLRT